MAQAIEAAKDDEATADDAEAAPGKNPATAAWIVVLVIGGLGVALLLTMAFSTANTGQSVTGRTATSWSPGPNE